MGITFFTAAFWYGALGYTPWHFFHPFPPPKKKNVSPGNPSMLAMQIRNRNKKIGAVLHSTLSAFHQMSQRLCHGAISAFA